MPNNTRIIADSVNPKKFYGMSLFEGKLFLSNDGAVTFVEQPFTLPGGLPMRGNAGQDAGGGQGHLYATPGREGDLWLGASGKLYHSTDVGKTFTKVDGVTELHGFGFGKGAPGASNPALYMAGIANGLHGILR